MSDSANKVHLMHPSDDQLELYSMGRLTEAEVAPLEEHLLICRGCRDWLVLTDSETAAIREALKAWKEKGE